MNKLYRDSELLVYFGDKDEAISLQNIKESRYCLNLQNIIQDYGLKQLVVLNQIHASVGVCVDDMLSPGRSSWFEVSGDFLVTRQKNIALVVLTADCVPLIIYDPVSSAIALVHAGWRGSCLGVVQEALCMMQKKYAIKLQNLICFFGPSARACCYGVSKEFVDDFKKKYPDEAVFIQRSFKSYFDNSFFLQQILKKFGILTQNIYIDNAFCTICDLRFCSFRREKDSAQRQITMVALR